MANVIIVLNLEGKRKNRFPNFISSSVPVKILNLEPNDSEFGQI